MKFTIILWFVVCLCVAYGKAGRRFPDNFMFGASTAAYQIEGGWNADDKGESIWDRLVHSHPEAIKDRSNGDIAADSYHNYKRDVEMMRELGLDCYRFSISWSRVLPTGHNNYVSKAGIAFYNDYINEMIKYNITPIATLFHWDLPQKLQDLGGLMNPMFVDWFEDYARVVFENFGDRVKHWITFNEPCVTCNEGYGSVTKAPRVNATGVGEYLCAKHLVMAHARAYHAFNKDFKPHQGGICGITIIFQWYEALTSSKEDLLAAKLKRQADWGIYTDPIFSKEGGFPKELAERVNQKSVKQGFLKSRMPDFTEEEKAFVRGSADFLGVNHYSAALISANGYTDLLYLDKDPVPSLLDDIETNMYQPLKWQKGASYWLAMAPNSLYVTLTHLKKKYNNPLMFITENGWSTPAPGVGEELRIKYYRQALNNVLDALDDGINIKGYMAWSLMDNFEWMEGYTERFGLYEVDFEDPARKRTPRKTAFIYKEILKSKIIDPNYEPLSTVMTIDKGH